MVTKTKVTDSSVGVTTATLKMTGTLHSETVSDILNNLTGAQNKTHHEGINNSALTATNQGTESPISPVKSQT